MLTIEPDERAVTLYRSPADICEYTGQDALQLEDIPPGFNLPLTKLWGKVA